MPDLETTPGPQGRAFVYYHRLPDLNELLPTTRGLPGVEYLVVCTDNLRKAQDSGWSKLTNSVIFTIVGDKGEADCELYAYGKPIKGQDIKSGRRELFYDKDVMKKTGITNGLAEPEPEKPVPAKVVEASKSKPSLTGA